MRAEELQRALAKIISQSGSRPPSLIALNDSLKMFGSGSLDDFLAKAKTAKKRPATPRLQRPVDQHKVNKWANELSSFRGSVEQFRNRLQELKALDPAEVRAIHNKVLGKNGETITRPKAIEALGQAFAAEAVAQQHERIAKRLFG
jgi:hypothetical protein